MKLNLGCGRLLVPGYVNVDARPLEGVDVVADLAKKWPWQDGEVRHVRAHHILEHILDVPHFMAELHRVLAPGGTFSIVAPRHDHINAWTDPTHVRAVTPLSLVFWTGRPDYESYGPVFRISSWRTRDEVHFAGVKP